MYVVTFYSFKGGVGRTFALVNVATELARSGRRVLLVDFDLEAPGIQTFEQLRSSEPHPGVVEFVTTYAASGSTPDIRDYVYETSGVAQSGGRLWVMPAGKGDSQYRRQLADLHWPALYRHLDGYMAIEDMKAQWGAEFNPDYVFIDSRTGHTDVEGICTRQLPDAVVLLFFPNEQNLMGLRQVVGDIRGESKAQKIDSPLLHFVVSNVPELDDEEDILKKRIREFRRSLAFEEHRVIHNYPSLALVNQVIFAIDRPNSRLTREYRRLKDEIIKHNMEDREAALEFLTHGFRPFGRYEISKQEVEDRLDKIRQNEKHRRDGEILYRIAMLRKLEGRAQEARELFDRAIETGFRNGPVYLERAFARHTTRSSNSNRDAVIDDIKEALRHSDLTDDDVERAARLLGVVDESQLSDVTNSPALRSVDAGERLVVANAMMKFRGGLGPAIEILKEVVQDEDVRGKDIGATKHFLILALIGNGQFEEAIQMIGSHPCDPKRIDKIENAFNVAMCYWGSAGRRPVEHFRRVLELHDDPSNHRRGANYDQCIALAYACTGDSDRAIQFSHSAESKKRESGGIEFSCWRYRNTDTAEFVEDCEQIRQLAAGADIMPAFLENGSKD